MGAVNTDLAKIFALSFHLKKAHPGKWTGLFFLPGQFISSVELFHLKYYTDCHFEIFGPIVSGKYTAKRESFGGM
jgi:hypothetical protein